MEKFQAAIYLATVIGGLAVGTAWPQGSRTIEWLVWPTLAALLYTTFVQLPLTGIREALTDHRFFGVAVVGNFVVLPLVVWGLLPLLPPDPAVRLGVVMVLVLPCTDWFITFTQLAGGDTRRAVLFAPISLALQMVLLPLYLLVLLGGEVVVHGARTEMLSAFLGLIVIPFLLALVTPRTGRAAGFRSVWLPWLPVPLLAATVFLIAASQVETVRGTLSAALVLKLVAVFTLFLIVAAVLAWGAAALARVEPRQGRVLAFSFGTRNSFVVLPLALALPAGFELAVVVIVVQSLVELFGMIAYLWWVPRVLFPDQRA